jgi:hypothetical protein
MRTSSSLRADTPMPTGSALLQRLLIVPSCKWLFALRKHVRKRQPSRHIAPSCRTSRACDPMPRAPCIPGIQRPQTPHALDQLRLSTLAPSITQRTRREATAPAHSRRRAATQPQAPALCVGKARARKHVHVLPVCLRTTAQPPLSPHRLPDLVCPFFPLNHTHTLCP